MKHNEVVGINSFFQDVYDITAEHGDYWKRFIPNNKFDTILKAVIDCIEAPEMNNKKSIWIQGTYGTGKSHATSVVKHLMGDDYNEVEGYIDSLSNNQLKAQLKSFRKTKKVFPVVLKGISNVVDHLSLNFVLQNAVKKALHQKDIFIDTKSDFEVMIEKLNDTDLKEFWTRVIENDQELKQQANSTEDIIQDMLAGNTGTLRILKRILEGKNLYSSYINITDWLSEVLKNLRDANIADYLMIFWDEFTSVLDSQERKGILNQIQNIAELSKSGIYLYIVSHKKLEVIESYRELKEDEKTQAKHRFRTEDYSMQPITTYHIISGAINKKLPDDWKQFKVQNIDNNPEIKALIERLTQNEGADIKSKIGELYPIHPYTAYLSTVVSRDIGSTERSIFKFLNDGEKGFLKFIESEMVDEPFLTSEYVWDFFMDEFEKDTTGKFSAIIDKYNLCLEAVENKNIDYLSVFKVVLLLNVLYRITITNSIANERSLLVPYHNNIIDVFKGTNKLKYVEEALKFFDESEIVHMSPEGIYEIAYSSLPPKEVEDEKRKELVAYEDVTKILANFGNLRISLENSLKNQIYRESENAFLWAGEYENILKNKFEQGFTLPYAIQMPIFLIRGKVNVPEGLFKKEERTYTSLQSTLLTLSNQKEYENKVFLISTVEFGGKRLERFTEYIAQSTVAKKHNIPTEAAGFLSKAQQYVQSWIDEIKVGDVEVLFRGASYKKSFSTVGKFINDTISKQIFQYGAENIKESMANSNTWKKQKSPKVVECFVFPDSKKDLADATKNAPYNALLSIVKNDNGDFIIENNLRIKDDNNANHSTITIANRVREVMEKQKGKASFNVGTELKFLSEPPYGLYTNMMNMALLGFVMREYIGKVFEEGSGKPIDKHLMRDKVVSLFNYWQENSDKEKLNLRFSTEEEKKLIDILKSIFHVYNTDGLNNIKWKIRDDFVEKQKCPIWSLKYCDDGKKENIKKVLDEIFKFTLSLDTDISQNEICNLLDLIDNNKLDLISLLNPQNVANSFNNFLIEVCGNGIEEKIGKIIDYLNANMQEELAFWKEEEVKIKVLLWERDELKKENEKNNTTNSTGGTQNNGSASSNGQSNGDKSGFGGNESADSNTNSPINEGGAPYSGQNNTSNKKQKAIEKVKNYNGTLDIVKQKILDLLEDDEEFASIIERIFD